MCFRIAALVLALAWGEARAAESLYLTWDDCPLGSHSSNRTFACNDPAATHELLAAFFVSDAIDSVLGAEIVIDLQAGVTTLPDWWRFDFGGCRDGAQVRSDVDFGGRSACLDFWQGDGAGGVLSYTPGMPLGGANQARLRIAFGTFEYRTIPANGTYYAARIEFGSAGTDTCAGCLDPVCLVLNGIRIKRPPRPEGALTGDILLTVPGAGDANWARWQGSPLTNCAAVPVRRQSWGRLKALYR